MIIKSEKQETEIAYTGQDAKHIMWSRKKTDMKEERVKFTPKTSR